METSPSDKKQIEVEEDRHYDDLQGKRHQNLNVMSSGKGSGGPFSQSHGVGRNMAQHGDVNLDRLANKPGYAESKGSDSAAETFAKHVTTQEKHIHTAK
jgi:hypothetical protein